MAEVFVSYKAEDRARVKPLVDALAAEGLSVWWDLHIEAGAAWRETIREKLDAAACVIVVWSVVSIGPAGHFVQDEASVAKRRGVYLPVAIDEVAPPLGFGQEHCLKLVGWRGGRRDPQFTDVLAAARAVIDGGPRPIPKARASSLRPNRLSSAVAVLAALALVAAGGAFIAWSPARLCAVARLDCPPAAPANSIAVMPLADLGGQAGQGYFADGLTDELINGLERLGALQVVGRTSAFRFKGRKESSAVIGRKLGVAYLLDGSVQRDGAHLRVSLSLIDAPSGFERWSQTYDREMTDIFAVETGIAQDVAQALKVRLSAADLAGVTVGGASNPVAFDAYLRGRQVFDQGGDEAAYREALAQFDAAIAADPAFATAHAARARVLLTIADTFAPTAGQIRASLDAAMAAARRATDLAPSLPLAQAALGGVLFHELDFPAARAAYARALAMGGGDAQILTLFAYFSSNAGEPAAAIAAARRAVALDPLNPRAFSVLGTALYDAGRYGESITAHRRELDLNAARASAHYWIGAALYLQGRFAQARREFSLEPVSLLRVTGAAIALQRLDDAAGARAALAQLTASTTVASDYQQAEIQAQWGQSDLAFRALDAAFAAGDTGLINLKVDPLLEPLRRDPRYARLLPRLGLTTGA